MNSRDECTTRVYSLSVQLGMQGKIPDQVTTMKFKKTYKLPDIYILYQQLKDLYLIRTLSTTKGDCIFSTPEWSTANKKVVRRTR